MITASDKDDLTSFVIDPDFSRMLGIVQDPKIPLLDFQKSKCFPFHLESDKSGFHLFYCEINHSIDRLHPLECNHPLDSNHSSDWHHHLEWNHPLD
jgi:hypothetical protein